MKKIKGGVTVPEGFKSSGTTCGIKQSGKKDMALIYSEKLAEAAAVFTTNEVKAAPVLISRNKIKNGKARAIIVNSGNANACTGEKGLEDAKKMTELTAANLKISPEEVLVASTGKIGENLNMEKITKGIEQLSSCLEKDDLDAAEAILTTDDNIKRIAYSFKLPNSDEEIKIGGIAKGSGMIHPNMATMLGFITTDIKIENRLLNEALKKSVKESFNRISVDGDQSTNDSAFLLANGQAGNNKIKEKNEDYNEFLKVLKKVVIFLAKAIVADGEGTTKFITIKVKEAADEIQADKIARNIANSNLVKTALFGGDPNWGRILAAAGKARAGIDPEKMIVKVNETTLYKKGEPVEISEDRLSRLIKKDKILIEVLLGKGKTELEFWTGDLTYEYIEVNAEYHT
ncbi:MAG: bifunctional glutamate N-acetyltransferase/amino-acid acetyltransferase ArgJ [Halanaerobiales bacterium]